MQSGRGMPSSARHTRPQYWHDGNISSKLKRTRCCNGPQTQGRGTPCRAPPRQRPPSRSAAGLTDGLRRRDPPRCQRPVLCALHLPGSRAIRSSRVGIIWSRLEEPKHAARWRRHGERLTHTHTFTITTTHTCLSRSLSQRSLTVHPAPRSSTAPAPNRPSMVRSGAKPGAAARPMDQKQGQASSQVPVCGAERQEWVGEEGQVVVVVRVLVSSLGVLGVRQTDFLTGNAQLRQAWRHRSTAAWCMPRARRQQHSLEGAPLSERSPMGFSRRIKWA